MHTLVYWYGNIGVPGKGPNWREVYNPNRTIGELIQDMTKSGLGDRKRIEIFKHAYGDLSKYDKNNPHWPHNTKLSDYVKLMGGHKGTDIMLIYCMV